MPSAGVAAMGRGAGATVETPSRRTAGRTCGAATNADTSGALRRHSEMTARRVITVERARDSDDAASALVL